MLESLHRLWSQEDGQDIAEYRDDKSAKEAVLPESAT